MTAPEQRPALPDLSDLIGNDPGPRRPLSAALPRWVVVLGGAAVAAIVLALGGFLAGRATAASGPDSLAAAVQQTTAGKLPCGNLPTNLCNGLGRFGGGTGSGGGFGGTGGGGTGGQNGTGGGGTGGQNGTGGGGTGRGGFGGLFGPGAVTGTLTGVSGNSVQLETRAGTITVALPANVQITTTTAGSTKNLATGHTVVITTTTDSNGNRTAQRILVLPTVS